MRSRAEMPDRSRGMVVPSAARLLKYNVMGASSPSSTRIRVVTYRHLLCSFSHKRKCCICGLDIRFVNHEAVRVHFDNDVVCITGYLANDMCRSLSELSSRCDDSDEDLVTLLCPLTSWSNTTVERTQFRLALSHSSGWSYGPNVRLIYT